VKGCRVRWSVGIEAAGERVLTREDVVQLADAVAASGGIATGIGSTRYGTQLIVEADSREAAIERATAEFRRAAAAAGLPGAPVVRTEAVSEDEDRAGDGDGTAAWDRAGDGNAAGPGDAAG
jgi:hypothetical protein